MKKALGGAVAALAAAVAGIACGVAAASFMIDAAGDDGVLPERWQRGMNLTAFLPDAYGERRARRQMLTARATGTELVALVPTWYMTDATASTIVADPDKTPTDESLLAAAAAARELGLEVVIKPHVDVQDGTFRGEIEPLEPELWFDSYGSMIVGYARLAESIDADGLVVGTELTSVSLDPEPWRELIAAVRAVYEGELTFAANWVEGAQSIEFWDDLDAIGIDAYMPLQTPTATPTVAELVEAWGPYRVEMEDLHEEWDLPVLFTELGYESRVGTAARIDQGFAPVSQKAQADAYEAAFRALDGERWFEGIWWWEWSGEGLPPTAGGFTPEDKLAELVLAERQGPAEPLGVPTLPGG